MKRRAGRGLSTIEALVALSLLGIATASLLHTVANATRARATSSGGLRATNVALSVIEHLRVGSETIPPLAEGFEHEWNVAPVDGHPELLQYEVTVRWEEDRRQLTLEGLLWRSAT